MFEWHKKEAPVFTGVTRGVGGFGFGKRTATAAAGSISATGGNQSPANGLEPGNGYKYHTFTSPGTFTLLESKNIELLMVGGGGGGGAANLPTGTDGGAGGGAGGLVYVPSYAFTTGTYTVTIGAGGAGVPISPNGVDVASQKGGSTTFVGPITLTALGGGGGGSGPNGGPANTQAPFGSGGGQGGGGSGSHPASDIGVGSQPSQPQGIPSPNYLQYGNPGGTANSSHPHCGAGGGGAGAAGTPGDPNTPRGGGNGRQYPQFIGPLIGISPLAPLSGYFAGGGAGGGGGPGGDPNASGGLGGGGNTIGSGSTPLVGGPATVNTGSGGGGGSGMWDPNHSGTMGPGGNGGSGIVVIRYLV